MTICHKIKLNVRIFLRKILSYFSEVPEIRSALDKTLTTPYELRQVFQENRINYNDIDCPPDFNNPGDFHIIISDDNQGALALLEIDLEIILGQSKLDNLSDELMDVIYKMDQKILKQDLHFEIQKVGGNYAPYSIYRKVELDSDYRVDLAIIDIIFGGLVYKNDKPLRIDGIALARYLKEKNPNIEVVLFTGSDLEKTSKEYKDIVRYFGLDFLKTNVVYKNPNFEKRIFNFITLFKKACSRFESPSR